MKTYEEILLEVKEMFSNYLEKKTLRKTPERIAILEEIYNRNDHFEAESLYKQLTKASYRVSRATVYNTLELLVACDLVTKHQFGKNIAQYEKSFVARQHDHIICVKCKKVIEFCDPRIQQSKSMVSDLFDFTITHHSLNFYGICHECRIKEDKKENIELIKEKI